MSTGRLVRQALDGSSVRRLPLDGAEGWATASGFVTSSRLTSLDKHGGELSLSAAGRQANGECLLEVTSYRSGLDPMEELRSRTVRQARSLGSDPRRQDGTADSPTGWSAPTGQVAWTPAVIRVDDVPTGFAVANLEGGWAAVGEGPSSMIAIAARNVALTEISLVRLPDPPFRPRRIGRHRPPRARSFPAEALTDAEDALGPPNVDLTYADDRLTATYQGLAIELELHVPHSQSRTSGRFAGADMAATWRLGNNYHEHPDVHSSMHGRFADQTVTATGTFRHNEDWAIESAAITGHLGNQTIEAAVTSLDGGLSTTSTVAIDGHCAETTFALASHLVPATGHPVGAGYSGDLRDLEAGVPQPREVDLRKRVSCSGGRVESEFDVSVERAQAFGRCGVRTGTKT